MLQQLTIRDFVIVDRLELDFSAGFGTLTGETGAGKSILIDALALALGERADASCVRSGCDKAEVTAAFEIQAIPQLAQWLSEQDMDAADELILRRIVDAGGRSRAYINGSPATAQQLREVGEWLVDIHGQHAHQSLMRPDAQRALLDAHAGLTAEVRSLAADYRAWQAAVQQLAQARTGALDLQREREQLQWQVEELTTLGLTADEWPELELEHRRLAHAASLMEGAQFSLVQIAEGEGGVESQIDAVVSRLSDLSEYDPVLNEVTGLLLSVQAELSEAASSLRRYVDRVDLDPARLAAVESRMDAVLACARKYRVAPLDLPVLLVDWQARLRGLEAAADWQALENEVAERAAAYHMRAEAISRRRQAAAQVMGEAVSATMAELALSSGRFAIELNPLAEPAAFGLESVTFCIAGLAGSDWRPLAKVASGGELSRISLAIQVLTSRSAAVPTLIFDEVDVGIGGGVAEIVGRLLRQLGQERQVLCVTHLPQVAAQANWQWQVSKSQTPQGGLSRIEPLDEAGRVREIARMLGGVEITQLTLAHAREWLRSTP